MAKVLHASKSGYFPFCLTKGTPPATGLGTDYPISLTLEKYMSWWWKVKTWKLTGSSACLETATDNSGNPLVNNWTTTGLVQDDNWTSSIASEVNLVCQSNSRVIKNIEKGGVGFNADGTLGPSTNVSSITFEPSAYLDGLTIYPKMRIAGWYDTKDAGDPKVTAKLNPLSTFRIDGILIPTYINWFPAWTIYGNWAISGKQSFDLVPDTYWPYS